MISLMELLIILVILGILALPVVILAIAFLVSRKKDR